MKRFLPPKKDSNRSFSVLRSIIACVLIVVLLVSMSIGLSLAKFNEFTVPIAPDYYFHTHGLQGDTTRWFIFDKAEEGDTVIELMDGKVKITIPETATGANIDTADYYAIAIPDTSSMPSYEVNYMTTSSGQTYFQYSYFFRFDLRGFSYSNNLNQLNIGLATDTNRSISLEIKVGKDFESTTLSPSGGVYDEDDGVVRYSGLNRIYGRNYYVRYKKTSWAAYADTDWYNTSDTSFTIETAEELAGLAAIVNGTADGIDQDSFAGKNITLGDDISLYTDEDRLDGNGKEKRPWVPIGSFEAPFSGNFDGAGYTISGLNIPEYISQDADKDNTSGLFGMVKGAGSSVSISNVTLEDVNLSANLGLYTEADSGQSMGALAGYCENCSISDVHVDQLTVNRKAKYIGGIIGRGDAMGSISDCTVEGAVFDLEDCNNIGGIVGIHYGNGADVNISNCYVSAQFGGSYASAGGIVGFGNGGAVGVENCYFTGSFDPEEDDSFNGGILGIGFSGVDNDYIINNCYANCDADLIGHGYFGYTAYTGEETIDYCLANYGNNLVVVNSSWSGDNDSFTWESYATDAGYDGYSHTVYKSDDYCYPDSAPSIYWTITTESEDDDEGTASNDATDDKIVKENDHTVTLNATPESGYEFDEWVIEGDYSLVGDSKLTDASCVIKPSGNITATAKFKQAQAYTITLDNETPEYGTITADKEIVTPGETVTITITANTGYMHSTTFTGTYENWVIEQDDPTATSVFTFIPTSDMVWTVYFEEL